MMIEMMKIEMMKEIMKEMMIDDGDGEAENCDDDKSVGVIEDEKNLHVQAPWVDESSGEVDKAGEGINVNVTNFTD